METKMDLVMILTSFHISMAHFKGMDFEACPCPKSFDLLAELIFLVNPSIAYPFKNTE